MTDHTTLKLDPIGIRWPMSDDELKRMDRDGLADSLAEAKTAFQEKVDELLSFIERFGGPRESEVRSDLLNCLIVGEWYRVLTIHAATFNARHRTSCTSKVE